MISSKVQRAHCSRLVFVAIGVLQLETVCEPPTTKTKHSQNQTVTACPAGKYGDTTTRTCTACPTGCKTCTDGDTCTSCESTHWKTAESKCGEGRGGVDLLACCPLQGRWHEWKCCRAASHVALPCLNPQTVLPANCPTGTFAHTNPLNRVCSACTSPW